MSVEVHATADGPGGDADTPTVVLSGSLGSDLGMWYPQVGPLVEAGYRVVRYDHRGHGASPVPNGPYSMADLGGDAVALLDALRLGPVHWVGLSLGGMVGMWLGKHAGDRLASLTLCCTSAALDPTPWAERTKVVRARGTTAVAGAVVDRWLTPEYAEAHPETVRWMRGMIEATPDEGYASCCTAIATMDLAGGLGSIATPTLVLAGERDPATPPGHGRRIAETIPGARFAIVGQAAHLANVECADEVNRYLIEHVKETA
ncbi:3-oxoadipate enol-lactonase [Haloechinothrix sp. LS1_15]|uniref:3-oxoadipate enol-lactonase n=1 Tax=Haloechinothrix sp. LS1_15 TaxID=2652248 RepID=UPI002944893F|nr:3-oxoadipate enol-lactonase [Haloechinothrix sp. LS1_15]MDV6013689.1 3-oxoadipate enol-lactonase [Haloechinothrix sp. LS1_15]